MRNTILLVACGCFIPVLFDQYLGLESFPLWVGYLIGMFAVGKFVFGERPDPDRVKEFVRWIVFDKDAAEISWKGTIHVESLPNHYTLDFKIHDNSANVPNEADAGRASES